MSNPFFTNSGPFKIKDILNILGLNKLNNNYKIYDIKDLTSSTQKDITFFHSNKYSDAASKTKALYCITTNQLKHLLPNKCSPILVENVLLSVSLITKAFYLTPLMMNLIILLRKLQKQNIIKKLNMGKIF